MLEVVQEKHELAAAEEAAEIVGCADRSRDLGRDEARVGERAQSNPEDPVRDGADELGRDLKRKPRLPRSPRPGDGDQPPLAEKLDELGHLSLASEQRARRDRQVGGVERPER